MGTGGNPCGAVGALAGGSTDEAPSRDGGAALSVLLPLPLPARPLPPNRPPRPLITSVLESKRGQIMLRL